MSGNQRVDVKRSFSGIRIKQLERLLSCYVRKSIEYFLCCENKEKKQAKKYQQCPLLKFFLLFLVLYRIDCCLNVATAWQLTNISSVKRRKRKEKKKFKTFLFLLLLGLFNFFMFLQSFSLNFLSFWEKRSKRRLLDTHTQKNKKNKRKVVL